MIARSTLYGGNGGDTTQVLKTAEHLRKLTVEVDVKLANEKIDYEHYDLLHFFNLIRPADILKHKNQSKLPFVISTIYVDYSAFEKSHRGLIFRILSNTLGKHKLEYLKALARHIKGNEKLPSLEYIFNGHSNSIKEIVRAASFLLPNSQNEYNRLLEDFRINTSATVIPNAIDAGLFQYKENPDRAGILCVARIERLKNQLNLIKAANNLNQQLTIIGKPAPNQIDYYQLCRKEAKDNITFIDEVPHEGLAQYYHKHRVHVLASWFETTGLVSLEAAACGCNIVITEMGDTREYFQDYAQYCNPQSVASIESAIQKAMKSESSVEFRKKIMTNYTWEATAEKTLTVYKSVLADD